MNVHATYSWQRIRIRSKIGQKIDDCLGDFGINGVTLTNRYMRRWIISVQGACNPDENDIVFIIIWIMFSSSTSAYSILRDNKFIRTKA